MEVPEKDAVVGARDEQPCVCVLMLTVLIIGAASRVIQIQSAIKGSGVTV